MVHPGKLSLAAIAIALPGLALGAVLGNYANPAPLAPQPSSWAATLGLQVTGAGSYTFYESLPEDTSPRNLPDSYAPAFASSELSYDPADVDLPAYAEYEYELDPLPEPTFLAANSEDDALGPAQTEHTRPVDQIADEAEAVVAEALQAQQAAAGEARLIQVAEVLAN